MLSTEGSKLMDFVCSHLGEIRGLYNDSYWKNGGWNGTIDSFNEVQKRYKFKYDDDKLGEGEFERIFKDVLKGA